MGTRADFYVGRGKSAEWIGSIAWDGYPDGTPQPLRELKDEQAFRDEVAKILKETEGSTTPDQGWPWPWENSNTTDYAYAFDGGKVWGTCFGHGWWEAEKGDLDVSRDTPKIADWPDFSSEKMAPPGDKRSGIMVFSIKH